VSWFDVCGIDEITSNRGVAALFGSIEVALFRVDGDELLAIDNVDPFSGVGVLSRGIVGSAGDVLTVASPLYKQRFDLRTGACLDDDAVRIATFPARVDRGRVLVEL
jgi:nitrite reductase (NADH) small subunit